MSLKMIDYIVDEHNIEIDSESLKKVKVWLTDVLFYFVKILIFFKVFFMIK